MQKNITGNIIMLALLCASCHTHRQKTAEAAQAKAGRLSSETTTIDATITNANGETLHLSLDTAAHSAIFVFGGERMVLDQELWASGIRYSNKTYEYTEWQGERTLKKMVRLSSSNQKDS